MVQKKRRITAGKYHLLGLITAAAVISVMWQQSFVSLADSTGTVIVDSAKIREKADTSSEVIGSASSGKTISIKSEVQDASGTLWYEVYVDANTTGYIRSDLVEKKNGGDGSQTASQGNAGTESGASGATEEPGTVLDAQYAVVTAEAIKVRTTPSTSAVVVDRLSKDAQVIVSGQSDGNDGKIWYYVTFTGTNGAERTGYIRSDLLSLGDMVPAPEEEEIPAPQENAPEPEIPVNNDYELTYEQNVDGSGTLEWYVYDYSDKESPNQFKRYRLLDLMEATKQRSENDAADAKALVRQRVAIVILSVLMAALITLVILMALKLRDVYYEEYEDEEEEQEQDAAQRRRRTEKTEEVSAQRRRRAEESGEDSTQRRHREKEAEDNSAQRRRRTEGTEEATARRRRRMEDADDEAGQDPVNTVQKRKSKNFLLDDDEFEFEFLNMDDKGL